MPSTTAADNTPPEPAANVHFADADAAALLDGHVAELCDPSGHGWEQVKHNASRTVYRGHIGDETVYVKHYHSRSLTHRVLTALGASDARREMRCAAHLSANGVPTAEPLAGMFSPGRQWVATRGVLPSEPLSDWHVRQIEAGADGRDRIRRATGALGRMIGRMHAAGVIHGDLHCGNVLVRTDRGGESLVLMDLHRVRSRRRLSRRARAANLALLYHDRYDFTTRTERLRFLKHYLRESGAAGTLRGWAAMVEHLARRHTRCQNAQRDRRIVGRNRYFAHLKLPDRWSGHVILASKRRMAGSQAADEIFTVEQWREALANPESLFAGDDVELIKDSPSNTVIRRPLTVGGRTFDVYIKRPRRKGLRRWIVDCFRPSRTIRVFRLGHALLTRRIATALPMAALERRVGPVLTDNLLITEAVPEPRLKEFLNTWLARPPRGDIPLSVAAQRQLAQHVLWQMGRLLQRLHDNNFAHRDLKANNMLVRWSPETMPEIVLLDLDGLSRRRHLTARRKFQGLMRLNVSLLECPVVNHAGRLRMLLGYLRRPGSGRINFKPYWRMLERWSSRKLRQQIRSRRQRQRAVRRPA